MQKPISVELDLEVGAAYVSYAEIPDGTVHRTERISDGVHADYSESGDLVGVELLSLDEPAIGAARRFTSSRGLGFPRDLTGAAAVT